MDSDPFIKDVEKRFLLWVNTLEIEGSDEKAF